MDEALDALPFADAPTCHLLGPTALAVQAVMGVLVVLSLVYKRTRESPRRPWGIWVYDVAKQVVGQMFVHALNVAISDVLQRISDGNACIFYFLNILVDTTLGVGIIYIMLRFLTSTLTHRFHLAGFESGKYGDPPSFNYWLRQAIVYVVSITIMKLLVVGLFAAWPGIFNIGHWLLSWTGEGSSFQIIFTMGVFPIFMNIIQFWLIDSIVKAAAFVPALALDPEEGSHADREPLFRASTDDEDDDEGEQAHNAVAPTHEPRPAPHKSVRGQPKAANDEAKSAGASTPATGSSSRTGTSFSLHAYPPRGAAAGVVDAVVEDDEELSPGSARSNSSRRRSPPPELLPRSPLQPAINSPMVTPALGRAAPVPKAMKLEVRAPEKPAPAAPAPAMEAKDEEDDPWGEDWGDDWAGRVGQEDWTGKRLEAARGFVGTAWNAPASPAIQVG